MRLNAVRTTPIDLPRKSATRRANQPATGVSKHVLVEVETDDGVIGRAEALSKVEIYGETQKSIVSIIAEVIEPMLLGLDPLELDEANSRLENVPANNSARAAVDIALHDLVGKILGLPLYRLWGGSRSEQRVSWTVGIRQPREMAQEAVAMNNDYGIDAFKVKGGESPEDDIEAIRLIRERLPDAQLSLDANEGYSFQDARRALGEMSRYGLAYVEEPIPHHDWRARLKLSNSISIPILGDDSCFTLPDVLRELELGAIGMVSIKTPRTGFWQSFKILEAAESHGVQCLVGNAVGGTLSSIAALHFACSRRSLAIPSENSSSLNLKSDIVLDAPLVQTGSLTVPAGPGLGVELAPDALASLLAESNQSRPKT